MNVMTEGTSMQRPPRCERSRAERHSGTEFPRAIAETVPGTPDEAMMSVTLVLAQAVPATSGSGGQAGPPVRPRASEAERTAGRSTGDGVGFRVA